MIHNGDDTKIAVATGRAGGVGTATAQGASSPPACRTYYANILALFEEELALARSLGNAEAERAYLEVLPYVRSKISEGGA